jgi:hypothetical protein
MASAEDYLGYRPEISKPDEIGFDLSKIIIPIIDPADFIDWLKTDEIEAAAAEYNSPADFISDYALEMIQAGIRIRMDKTDE